MKKNKFAEIREVILESGIKVKPVYGPEDIKDVDFVSQIGQAALDNASVFWIWDSKGDQRKV